MEEKKKIKLEIETDPETANLVYGILLREYNQVYRHVPGERLSDFIEQLEKKIKQVVG
jgi:hypothetical protein